MACGWTAPQVLQPARLIWGTSPRRKSGSLQRTLRMFGGICCARRSCSSRPTVLDRVQIRARPGQPFKHQPNMVIARIVQKRGGGRSAREAHPARTPHRASIAANPSGHKSPQVIASQGGDGSLPTDWLGLRTLHLFRGAAVGLTSFRDASLREDTPHTEAVRVRRRPLSTTSAERLRYAGYLRRAGEQTPRCRLSARKEPPSSRLSG